ncbi:L-iditol 2-dehydrogenase [Exophiala viscosa]|uniref:L-iditol 2-dehydrogenase n=1 Tax=Exophiala viscosa TaxID=2486360 RepID=A0AAN6IGQ1_9EURO|nr:L-iditol 2-dehydrogenase [Exophiala viscosa]KAI1629533.1 L-iditol 2-dehydrogenase [Exophiala viscosa]
MDSQVQQLVEHTWEKFSTYDLSQRLLIAISGIPGSGKTTLASSVVHSLNKKHHDSRHTLFPNSPESGPSSPDIAFVVPLDGYHLTRKQLAALPNAEEAIFRRGAAFTFDAQSYLELVEKLRRPIMPETPTIYAPSFDHAVKDPVSNDIAVPPTARIIVFEGLYTALDEEGWRDAHALMDEMWFVETDIETATQRVAKRNFGAGITKTFEESLARTKESDMRNARDILDHRLHVDQVIPSVEDESWRSEEVVQVENELERSQTQADNEANAEEVKRQQMMRMDSIAELAADGVGM